METQCDQQVSVTDPIDRRLLDEFQRELPVTERPFDHIARRLGIGEEEVLTRLQRLSELGLVSRVGAVFDTRRIGASTLAAMAVPRHRLETVAELVSEYTEVNHNYEREHHFNLWFVATAPDQGRLEDVLGEIAARTGITVLDLPMERDFHIDLGFALQWS